MICPPARATRGLAFAAASTHKPGRRALDGVAGQFVTAQRENPHRERQCFGTRAPLHERARSEDTRPLCGRDVVLALFGWGASWADASLADRYQHVLAARLRTCASRPPWQNLQNLLHPSAWRVVSDGVTLRTGATVVVVLAVFTDASGQKAVEILGRTPHCPRSTAAEVGGSVVTRLETSLRLNTRTAECATSLGLAVARPGETSAQRGMLLTCALCD